MIRRMLCMLMLLVFALTTAAADEACQLSVTIDALAHTELEAMLTDAGIQEPKADSVQALAEFFNALSLQVRMQEDGAYFGLLHGENPLLDLGVYADAANGYVASTFLPQHCLHMTVTPEESAATQEATQLLENMDWPALGEELWTVLSSTSLTVSVEKGDFLGDAYEDGTQRTTLQFSDVELAAAVDAMLAVLDKHGLNDQLLQSLIGENTLLNDFSAWNQQIREKNQYSYVLHMVEDDQGMPVGVSFVTMEDAVQVMSFSLGFGDNGYRAVWGYGLNHQNIYIDLILIDGDVPEEKQFALTVYQDPARSGFRAVEPYYDYVQLMYSGTFFHTEEEGGAAWHGSVEAYGPGMDKLQSAWQIEGRMVDAPLHIRQTISKYPTADAKGEPTLAVTLDLASGQPEAWTADGLTLIEMDDPARDELMSGLMEEASANLLVELFRLLPAEVLTMLMF